MDEREEWCFEFRFAAGRPILRAAIDALLDEMIEWAEAHRLGIGGGYQAATAELAGASVAWAFSFGLCAGGGGRVIPRRTAGDLWTAVGEWCRRDGFELSGGFHPFPGDEETKAEE